jgi:large subunit ribosomal protein L19
MKAKQFTKETITAIGVTERKFPKFNVGDTIIVSQRIKEGDKERLQDFEGDVIAMRKNGASSSFTVRKIGANNISVERIFPFYSPLIETIQFKQKGDVRRAKLYYLRDRVGRAARVKEKVQTKEQKEKNKNG